MLVNKLYTIDDKVKMFYIRKRCEY